MKFILAIHLIFFLFGLIGGAFLFIGIFYEIFGYVLLGVSILTLSFLIAQDITKKIKQNIVALTGLF